MWQRNYVPTILIIGSNFTVSDPRSDIKCVAYRSVLPFTVPDAKTITFVYGKTFWIWWWSILKKNYFWNKLDYIKYDYSVRKVIMIYFNIFYILHYILTFFKIVSASNELERRSKTSDSDKKNKRGNCFLLLSKNSEMRFLQASIKSKTRQNDIRWNKGRER